MNRWTGLHVASIHVVFKGLISPLEQECPSQEEESLETVF